MSFLYSTPEKIYCKLSSQSGRKIEEKPDVYTDLQLMDKDTSPPKMYDSTGKAFVILLKDMDLIKSVLLH